MVELNNKKISLDNKIITIGKGNNIIAINITNQYNGKHAIQLSLKDIISNNKQYVMNSLVAPWLASESISFDYFYSNNLYIQPSIRANGENENITINQYLNQISEKKCKTWVLGEAGTGKTTLIKHTFLEYIKSGKQAIYTTADNLDLRIQSNNSFIFENSINFDNDLVLFIDGVDETFANNPSKLNSFIRSLKHLTCEMWIGCRTQFFDKYAKAFSNLSGSRIIVQNWSPQDVESYIHNYYATINNQQKLKTIKNLLSTNESYVEFCKNPLRLSMLIYIVEKTPACESLKLTNDYHLYSKFFELWISSETQRFDCKYDHKHLYNKLYQISRDLYENNETTINEDNEIINNLLIKTPCGNNLWRIQGFYHRSLMEFLLAKNAIEAMLSSVDEIIQTLKYNNRADVDHFIKRGFEKLSYKKLNRIVENAIPAYTLASKSLSNSDELFYVQDQIVYYLTRMKTSKKESVVNFIREIYQQEKRPIMRQGIAYGAAILDMFDIALQFAKEMSSPESDANVVNRSWTLIFYGDVTDITEDPLKYKDDGIVPWDNSRNARLRRFQGKSKKDKAFRMFDLCVMIGFYDSRGWKDLNKNDLEIIKNCETNISEFDPCVVDFLNEKKAYLVNEYIKHMN